MSDGVPLSFVEDHGAPCANATLEVPMGEICDFLRSFIRGGGDEQSLFAALRSASDSRLAVRACSGTSSSVEQGSGALGRPRPLHGSGYGPGRERFNSNTRS